MDPWTLKKVIGVCIAEDGTLAGSNIDLATAVRNAVRLRPVEPADAVRMASTGYRANLLIADDELKVLETWIDGSRSPTEPSEH
jgi:N-acetylglucosamine-6-phosphate deacetylase